MYIWPETGADAASLHSFSHSELGPHNECTCTTRLLRSNLRTVGISRWREHLAKSIITFHTGYRSAAPFLNVAFAPVRATDTFDELVETPRVDGTPKAPSPCPLPATSASVTKSVTVVEWGGSMFQCQCTFTHVSDHCLQLPPVLSIGVLHLEVHVLDDLRAHILHVSIHE